MISASPTLSPPSPKECIRDDIIGFAPGMIRHWSKVSRCLGFRSAMEALLGARRHHKSGRRERGHQTVPTPVSASSMANCRSAISCHCSETTKLDRFWLEFFRGDSPAGRSGEQ